MPLQHMACFEENDHLFQPDFDACATNAPGKTVDYCDWPRLVYRVAEKQCVQCLGTQRLKGLLHPEKSEKKRSSWTLLLGSFLNLSPHLPKAVRKGRSLGRG